CTLAALLGSCGSVDPCVDPQSAQRSGPSDLVTKYRRSDYLMDGASEGARLEAKTDAMTVRHRLELLRVPVGGRILDAGSGTGAIARVLAQMTGSDGE